MGVIVVLARSEDTVARLLTEKGPAGDVFIMTPADLSTEGWSYSSRAQDETVAVTGGRLIGAGDIGGVITRIPCVFEEDLGHIDATDRGYVAAEMTAFLLAWLSTLDCPIINRPTASALWGPNWCHEKWVQTAAGLGIPVNIARRQVTTRQAEATASPASGVTITVLGGRQIGDADPGLARQAMLLAQKAGVELLSVRFSGVEEGARFQAASIWPETVSVAMIDALLAATT